MKTKTARTEQPNLLEVPMPHVAGVNLSTAVRERPLVYLGGAFAVGYLLGGGLFTRLTGRIVAAAVRAAVLPLASATVDRLLAGDFPAGPDLSEVHQGR